MPAFEMTPEEESRYGASLGIWDQIRFLSAWSPLLAYGQRFIGESDSYKKGLIVAEALEWLSAKTDSRLDDELVNLSVAVLKTPEGEALVRWAVSTVAPQK